MHRLKRDALQAWQTTTQALEQLAILLLTLLITILNLAASCVRALRDWLERGCPCPAWLLPGGLRAESDRAEQK